MADHHNRRQSHRAKGVNVEPQTIVSVVYVTAEPTFTGEIGGYTTLGVEIDTHSTHLTKSKTESTPATKSQKAATTLATSTAAVTSKTVTDTTSLSGTSSISRSSATGSASTQSSTETESSGMSSGGKAAMVIGILVLIGAILALILCCFRKKRKGKHAKLEDEKHEFTSMSRGPPSTRSTPNAPRLSLRPVTQFMGGTFGEKRSSRGNALNVIAEPAVERANPWDRPVTAQSNNRENPFGNHAETIDAANANGPVVVEGVGPGGEIVSGAGGAAAAGAAYAGANALSRGASKRGPKPLDFTKPGPFMGPPSPAGTEFSISSEAAPIPTQTTGGAAIVAAGGPANTAVHRVQLDFNPSMDDELELRAGQLIRLLHEYDDGWAMCIRLDRSRQGVVPRTCLSTRPVKPRPQQNGQRGPPPQNGMRVPGPQQQRPMSPGGRPMTPNGHQSRPMTPNGQQSRPMTPNGQQRPMTPNGQYARPMTPNGQQSRPMTPNGQGHMTPNGQGRPRSNSAASSQARAYSPSGQGMNPQYFPGGQPRGPPPRGPPQGPPQGPVARKPIPGQAL